LLPTKVVRLKLPSLLIFRRRMILAHQGTIVAQLLLILTPTEIENRDNGLKWKMMWKMVDSFPWLSRFGTQHQSTSWRGGEWRSTGLQQLLRETEIQN
jgi:hypothetical protein